MCRLKYVCVMLVCNERWVVWYSVLMCLVLVLVVLMLLCMWLNRLILYVIVDCVC